MDWCNNILRPLLVFFFKFLYPHTPFHSRILWFFAKGYFVDGEEACRKILHDLVTEKKYGVLLNYCSEDAENLADILRYKKVYLEFLKEAGNRKDKRNPLIALSIKMSQFGCLAEDALLREKGRQILEETIARASHLGISVVLDAERLDHAEEIVAFALAMNKIFRNIKVRLQAYNPDFLDLVRRIVEEGIDLQSQGGRLPLGICKGAYHEERALSYRETQANFLEGILYCCRRNNPVSADTNDARLVRQILASCLEQRVAFPQLSVGMLYNVRPWFARECKKSGIDVALYLPVIHYGGEDMQDAHWESFAIRRLVEKPLYLFLQFHTAFTKLLKHQSY